MKHPTSLKPYITGFILSLLFTFIAFGITFMHTSSAHETIPHEVLLPAILVFAFIQLIVQLVFFLHVWRENKPRWNLLFFVCTFGLVLMVVVMSLWIMNHLNYNMTPTDMTNHILKDEGIHY